MPNCFLYHTINFFFNELSNTCIDSPERNNVSFDLLPRLARRRIVKHQSASLIHSSIRRLYSPLPVSRL
jgi:hypothetical protein